jgi:hypothetical protein
VGPPIVEYWYVPNQDSNIVSVLASGTPYTASTPTSATAYLAALQTALQNAKSPISNLGFLTSTFVPTAVVGAEIPQQITVDPSWGGLTPVFSSSDAEPDDAKKKKKLKVQNSVRGVVYYNNVLYVADEGGSAVRMYNPATGVPLGSTPVSSPVHLVQQNGVLYVTSGNTVLYGNCVTAPTNLPPLPTPNSVRRRAGATTVSRTAFRIYQLGDSHLERSGIEPSFGLRPVGTRLRFIRQALCRGPAIQADLWIFARHGRKPAVSVCAFQHQSYIF